jgi:hypothetical protein
VIGDSILLNHERFGIYEHFFHIEGCGGEMRGIMDGMLVRGSEDPDDEVGLMDGLAEAWQTVLADDDCALGEAGHRAVWGWFKGWYSATELPAGYHDDPSDASERLHKSCSRRPLIGNAGCLDELFPNLAEVEKQTRVGEDWDLPKHKHDRWQCTERELYMRSCISLDDEGMEEAAATLRRVHEAPAPPPADAVLALAVDITHAVATALGRAPSGCPSTAPAGQSSWFGPPGRRLAHGRALVSHCC